MAGLIFGTLPLEHWAEYPTDLDQILQAEREGGGGRVSIIYVTNTLIH